FLLSAGRNEDDSGNAPPPKLSEEDRNAVHRYLSSQAGRSQTSTAGLLQFVVDGDTLASFDPRQAGDIRFAVSGFAEFIEIRTIDRAGELLLAVFPLAVDAHSNLAEQQTEIELPGERNFMLSITPTRNAEGDITGATVRATSLIAGNVRRGEQTDSRPTLLGWLKPALAFALPAVLAAGLIYLMMERSAPKPPVITSTSPTPLPTALPEASPNASPLLAANSPTPAPTRKPTPRADEVLVVNLPSNPLLRAENLRRVEREEEVAASLLAGQKLFVDAKGASALVTPFVAALKQRLQADGTFQITDSSAEANIALKLNIESATRGICVISAIVNAKGEVLWPLMPGIRARSYEGVRENVIAELSRELLGDIQQLKQK
ncbi:MAG TPA: hypothetical protein PKC13_28050, partial [Blastocatellia bacterium]|nr:hypothetical protein [Blastocatellia bacterium]